MIDKVTYRNNANPKLSKDFFEKRDWQNGDLVCGIDEVGRGCLAGPLVVAAVILFENNRLKLLKDSKALTREELLKTAPRIMQNSWYSYAIISNNDIDCHNIYNATLKAMKQAILGLFATCPKLPRTILVDAMPLSLKGTSYENIEVNYFPKGESLSRSIAAASIIAKVKRDSLMGLYDQPLPGYSFNQHKGYGTKVHQNALSNFGDSILHRQSYLKKFEYLFARNPSTGSGRAGKINQNARGSTELSRSIEPYEHVLEGFDVRNQQQSIFCRSD